MQRVSQQQTLVNQRSGSCKISPVERRIHQRWARVCTVVLSIFCREVFSSMKINSNKTWHTVLVIYNAWSTYLLLEEQLQKIERCRTIERVYDMQSTWSDKGIVMETAWPRNKTKLSDNVMLSILKNPRYLITIKSNFNPIKSLWWGVVVSRLGTKFRVDK